MKQIQHIQMDHIVFRDHVGRKYRIDSSCGFTTEVLTMTHVFRGFRYVYDHEGD